MDAKDDGGLAIVRVKPLGAGGGGGEASAAEEGAESSVELVPGAITVNAAGRQPKTFKYPKHVIPPGSDQAELYDDFMPHRIDAFLSGCNVNIMAYGQTGSGKTHTMFGPPGIMAQAGAGAFGVTASPDYGLCPRGVLDILGRVQALRRESPGTQYVLTASAVELTMTEGNLDMLLKVKRSVTGGFAFEGASGVCIDRASKPPRLYGMTQLVLDSEDAVFELFRAIASRNTAATGMNDSSSRSHCFVFLTLYACDEAKKRVRTSRFQFVDLAGSERIEDAHKGMADWSNKGVVEGVSVNFSLMMLSACVRALVEARRKKASFSFRTYLVDLVMLLSESVSGSALSLVVVCISSASANASQSINALDFGEAFSRLTVKPELQKDETMAAAQDRSAKLIANGQQSVASERYTAMREAQGRDGAQLQSILSTLGAA